MKQLIETTLMDLSLTVGTKEEVINKLADLMETEGRLNDKALFIEKVMEREAVFPTAIGFNVAIPHGKTDAVAVPSVGFARLTKAIPWGEEEANIVFLLAVPEAEAGNRHLEILAQLSRKLMHEEFRTELNQVSSTAEVLKLLDL